MDWESYQELGNSADFGKGTGSRPKWKRNIAAEEDLCCEHEISNNVHRSMSHWELIEKPSAHEMAKIQEKGKQSSCAGFSHHRLHCR